MIVILSLLLLFAFAGVVGLGIYCGQLYEQVSQVNALTAQHEALTQKYNSDMQKLNEYAMKLQTENQQLAKWKGIANADAKAAEMIQLARSNVEKATVEAEQLVSTAQQRANVVTLDAE